MDKNDFIGKELAKYNLPDAAIAALKEKYLPYKVANPEDLDNYILAKEAHSEVRGLRIDVEKRRLEINAKALQFTRDNNTEAKRLTAELSVVENHLLAQRKVVEDERARIKREREEAEEKERLRLQKEEEDRLEKIRLEQEVKEKKIKEAQDKIEADKQKIAKDREKNRLEAERIENEKKHAKEVEKAKKEAAAKAKEEERARIVKEQEEEALKEREEKLEAERQEALKPDVEKLKALGNAITIIPLPDVKSKVAKQILLKARADLMIIAKGLLKARL